MEDETGQKQTSPAYGFLLCLRCRQAGHVVNDCPSLSWDSELAWFSSEQRLRMDFTASAEGSCRTELCQRCRDLDLSRFLHQPIPWEDRDGLDRAELVGTSFQRSIGRTGSVVFWSDCSLCRCLFALTPNPSSKEQEILMIPQWSITRLEGGAAANNEAKRSYAKCLLVFLDPSSISRPLSDRTNRGDALCVLEEDVGAEYATTLGGRHIDPNQLDFGIIGEWVSSCCRLHQATCTSIWSDNLSQIRLVDVSTRHVVPFPGRGCEYVTLSYVCGGVMAPKFQLGKITSPLPQTIEDAMSWVEKLGKQYLWVDSLCINQRDIADKERQINRLSDIYRGAFLNLVALTGTSADAGLPRFRRGGTMFPQLQCRIDGKRFVGLMPTLSQLVWICPWGSRAWTLQEALLAPRCVYVSCFQLYFECNAMQCSESLNETRSWIHKLSRNSKPAGAEWSETAIGAGVLRHPLVGLSGIKNNSLIEYGSALALYSCRSMTKATDAVYAFSGILQNLEKEYGGSFFCGFPVSEFQWGLHWVPQMPLKRRLNEYPTWSWAAWEGPVWQTFPTDPNDPHRCQPYLRIWRIIGDRTVSVFSSSSCMNEDMQYLDVAFPDDCASSGGVATTPDPQMRVPDALLHDSVAKEPYRIFVEGIVLHFAPDYSQPLRKVRERGDYELFRFVVNGVGCGIQIISIDNELEPWRTYLSSTTAVRPPLKQEEFLLVARDCSSGWVMHHLLLLHREGELATRRTALTLWIPDDRNSLQVLDEFHPRKKQLVLC